MSLFSVGKGWSLEIKLLGSTKFLHRKVWGKDFLAQLLACSDTGQGLEKTCALLHTIARYRMLWTCKLWKSWIPNKLYALRKALLHRFGLSSSSPTSSWFHPKARPWTPIFQLLRQVCDSKTQWLISNCIKLLIWCNTQGCVEDFTHQPSLSIVDCASVHWRERKVIRKIEKPRATTESSALSQSLSTPAFWLSPRLLDIGPSVKDGLPLEISSAAKTRGHALPRILIRSPKACCAHSSIERFQQVLHRLCTLPYHVIWV